ncbi:hypothetical protein EJB05_06946, partial [Eragrostis curvula]
MDVSARLVPHLLASILHKIEWRLPGSMSHEDVDLGDHHRTYTLPEVSNTGPTYTGVAYYVDTAERCDFRLEHK